MKPDTVYYWSLFLFDVRTQNWLSPSSLCARLPFSAYFVIAVSVVHHVLKHKCEKYWTKWIVPCNLYFEKCIKTLHMFMHKNILHLIFNFFLQIPAKILPQMQPELLEKCRKSKRHAQVPSCHLHHFSIGPSRSRTGLFRKYVCPQQFKTWKKNS